MKVLLIKKLKTHGIINRSNNRINVKWEQRLINLPLLLDEINQTTSFLEYDAPLLVRIQCILQNITHQPKCKVCNNILKMRLSGRETRTFGETCGSKCFSQLQEVKDKRFQTNIERYGGNTPIHDFDIRWKISEKKRQSSPQFSPTGTLCEPPSAIKS